MARKHGPEQRKFGLGQRPHVQPDGSTGPDEFPGTSGENDFEDAIDSETDVQAVIDADASLARRDEENTFTESQTFALTGGLFDLDAQNIDMLAAVGGSVNLEMSGMGYLRISNVDQRVEVVARNDATNGIYIGQDTPGSPKPIQIGASDDLVGAFGVPAVVRPVVTGSQLSGAALASLLTALDALGWIDDQTTA